jgi:predicted Zn-dependent peptidase
MILNSVFKKKEFDLEMPILLEEMIQSEDDANTQLFTEVDQFMYKGSPYSRPIDDIEYHRSKKTYDYQSILDYYHTYYQPCNIVISVVSNESFDKIRQVLSTTFFVRNKSRRLSSPSILIQQNPTTNQITYKIMGKKGMESQHLCIAFRTCSHSNTDRFALNLLAQIVGGSMSSRMRMLLREENGLTYESDCSTDYLKVGGDFSIYAVLNPSKLLFNGKKKGVLPLMIELVKDIMNGEITEDELKMAKGNYKGSYLLQQQHIKNVAEYNGVQCANYEDEPWIAYNKIYETYYDKLEVKDLKTVIAKYFIVSNMFVGIIGEKGSHYPSLEKIKEVCEYAIH